jgi:shikimate dehydrogenase
MIKLGVIGYPVKHTLSPVMHNAALAEMSIPGVYLPFEVDPDSLRDAVKGLSVLDFQGYNVTIPFKVSIMDLIDDITEEASLIGSVNTVIIYPSRKTLGANTDIFGFMETFSNEDKELLKGNKAAVLGAGGASRAIGVALCKMGLKEVALYDVYPEKAEDTCKHLNKISFNDTQFKPDDVKNVNLEGVKLLVNASPVGMHPNDHQYPLDREHIECLDKKSIVFDLIYRPQKTVLLKYAEFNGLKVYNGSEMLVRQGAKSLEMWVNQEVPVDIMRDKVIESLENEI